MTPYNVLRYYVGPPLLMISTTVGVQTLALVGGDGTQQWSILGSTYSWIVVVGLLIWALCSLWVSLENTGSLYSVHQFSLMKYG